MRRITIADGLTVRFPGRSRDFDEGVEIGVLAAQMASGIARFEAEITRLGLDQARRLADSLGYRITENGGDDTCVSLIVSSRDERPRLKIVAGSARQG